MTITIAHILICKLVWITSLCNMCKSILSNSRTTESRSCSYSLSYLLLLRTMIIVLYLLIHELFYINSSSKVFYFELVINTKNSSMNSPLSWKMIFNFKRVVAYVTIEYVAKPRFPSRYRSGPIFWHNQPFLLALKWPTYWCLFRLEGIHFLHSSGRVLPTKVS